MIPRLLNGERVPCITLSVNQNVVPLSTATMEVFKQNALAIRTYVEIATPNGITEIYRTRQPQVNHGSDTATIQLDHAICEVGDYLVQDAINEEKTLAQALSTIFSHYRGSKWQLGTVTATDTVLIDCDYGNVLESILAILEQVPQYMLTFDFTTTPWTVGIAEKSSTVTAEGRLSRNIAQAMVREDDKDLCTRVYVKGLPKPTGRESDENAIGYMDADTISTYGIVEKETGSGELTQEQATHIATAYLNSHKHPRFSIEISGDDLSEITGESLDSFVCGKRFRLAIPDDNVVIEDYITKVSFSDALTSSQTNITIGDDLDPTLDFLKKQASNNKSSRRTAKKQDKISEGLGHWIEETDEHWKSMYWDGYNGLSSRIEQTARYWQAEFSDMYNGLHSFVEITAQHFQTEFDDMYNGFNSRFEATASYWRNEIENVYTGLSSRVEQTERSWSATVQAIGSDGQINAGTIAVAINNAGESEAHIDANKVYIGNSKSTTVINGKCSLSDITADVLKTKIADIASLGVNAVSGDTASFGNLYGGTIKFRTSSGSGYVYSDIKTLFVSSLSLSLSGNTYTLKSYDANANETVVGTFSRATSLSGTWSGGALTVTASPQGETFAVNMPTSAAYGSSITPSTNPSVSGAPQYDLSVDKNYAYIKYHPNANTVARVSNPYYGNGWSAAYAGVNLPSSASYGDHITIGTPSSTVDGTANSTQYDLKADNSYAYIKYHPNSNTVARISIAVAKSQISLTRGSVTVTEPKADDTLLKITANGWYKLTVTVRGVSKTYKLQIAA